MIDATALLDALNTLSGDAWLQASLALEEAGYKWVWTFFSDGTDQFSLVDA